MADQVQDYVRAYEKRAVVREIIDIVRDECLPLGGQTPRREIEAETPFGTRVVASASVSEVIQALLKYDSQLEKVIGRYQVVERNSDEPEIEDESEPEPQRLPAAPARKKNRRA
jgi:hypothetical protein